MVYTSFQDKLTPEAKDITLGFTATDQLFCFRPILLFILVFQVLGFFFKKIDKTSCNNSFMFVEKPSKRYWGFLYPQAYQVSPDINVTH